MNEWKAFRGTMMENTVQAFARHRTEALEAAAKVAEIANLGLPLHHAPKNISAAIRNMKGQP